MNYMYGVISGVPVPYVLPQPDGCKLGLTCPLQAGLTYTEDAVFPVLKEYPTVYSLPSLIFYYSILNNFLRFLYS
jgi:hypothetical protein